MISIDLFVREPFDFESAYQSRLQTHLTPEVAANFVSFDDLVALKREANRPKDLQDIYYLQNINRP